MDQIGLCHVTCIIHHQKCCVVMEINQLSKTGYISATDVNTETLFSPSVKYRDKKGP